MTVNSQSFRCIVSVIFIAITVTGCTTSGSRSKTGGSFVKVRPPGSKPVASTELKLAAARVMMRDEQYSNARKMFKEILEKEPENVEAILGIAKLDLLAMRQTEAEEGFRKAVTLAPNDPNVMNVVAEYYVSREDYPKAVELYERAVELDPDQKANHYHLAVALTRTGRINESIPHFTQSVGAAAAHYNVGRILCDQKKFDQSEQQFLQALGKDPKLTEAREWLGEVRRMKQNELAMNSVSLPSRNQSLPVATEQPAESTSPSFPSRQILMTGNSSPVLSGGAPNIVTQPTGYAERHQSGMQPSSVPGASSYANHPTQPIPQRVNPAFPAGMHTELPGGQTLPNGLSPAQLEQMRNQQLRTQSGIDPRTAPQAY